MLRIVPKRYVQFGWLLVAPPAQRNHLLVLRRANNHPTAPVVESIIEFAIAVI